MYHKFYGTEVWFCCFCWLLELIWDNFTWGIISWHFRFLVKLRGHVSLSSLVLFIQAPQPAVRSRSSRFQWLRLSSRWREPQCTQKGGTNWLTRQDPRSLRCLRCWVFQKPGWGLVTRTVELVEYWSRSFYCPLHTHTGRWFPIFAGDGYLFLEKFKHTKLAESWTLGLAEIRGEELDSTWYYV